MRQFKKGFTLLEVILVITILSLIMVVSITSLGVGKTRNNLKTAQREVASTIRLAESYALQGKVVSGGRTPCGFGFRFKDEDTYEIFYVFSPDPCSETAPAYSTSDRQSLESLDLKNNVSFQGDTADSEIFFTIPHAEIFGDLGSSFSGASLILASPDSSQTKTISITPKGEITEE
ncbi:MAG: pilus assembly FimT family protein [Patescibacteria group bacterium]